MSIPRIVCARAPRPPRASSASLMPPAFPRPPVSTCALTTTCPPSSCAAARASAGLVARRPSDTGIPNRRKSSFPWYSCRSKARASLPGPRADGSDEPVCEHCAMSRTTILILVALGAALAGFVLLHGCERLQDEDPAAEASVAAGPQTAALDWRETYGTPGAELVFSVESPPGARGRWRVRLALENDSSVAYELGDSRADAESLLRADALRDGRRRGAGASGTTAARSRRPGLRRATSRTCPRFSNPAHPGEGTISAPGALVAGSWARVVFGTLVAVDEPRATRVTSSRSGSPGSPITRTASALGDYVVGSSTCVLNAR